jgi:hypothetical protein
MLSTSVERGGHPDRRHLLLGSSLCGYLALAFPQNGAIPVSAKPVAFAILQSRQKARIGTIKDEGNPFKSDLHSSFQ